MSLQQAFGDMLFWAALCAMCILGMVLMATDHSRWAAAILVAIVGLGTFGLIQQSQR